MIREANISRWIEIQRKMKWRLAVRIASHPEERWTKEAATWNPGPRIKAKASRRVGRPRKIWKDDINQFVKPDETEETRESDLKNNDTWIRAGKDKKDGKKLKKTTSTSVEAATFTTTQPKQLHTSHHRRPTTTHQRVDRNRTEAQGGTDASVAKADEGKQKQHAECVDNTAATQLSKLSDINLSCAPEQDLGLKSLNPVEIRQKSRHPPLYTTGPSSESEDSMVRSFRFSQTFLIQNSCLNHCHLQCGRGNSLPTEQELTRLTQLFTG